MNKLVRIFACFTLMCALTIPINASSHVNSLVLRHVNHERSRLGKQALIIDQELSNAAAKRSKEIVQKFSHERPNNKAWHTVYDDYQIVQHYIGENLAKKSYNYHPSDEELALDFYKLWQSSPGHYQNMIKTEYEMIGLAIHKEGNVYYMTQLFNSEVKKQDVKQNPLPNKAKEKPEAQNQAETNVNLKPKIENPAANTEKKDNSKKEQITANENNALDTKEEMRRKEIEKQEKEIEAKEKEKQEKEIEAKKKELEIKEEEKKKDDELSRKQNQAEKQISFIMGLVFAFAVIAITTLRGFKS